MLAAFLYILAVVAANLTAATVISVWPFGMIAFGTLFFGATFTLRDRAHRRGKPFVYKMIAIAAVVNVIVAYVADTPARIIVASFIAIVLNEAADTEVFERLRNRHWIVRVAASNAVSIPIDTVLFTLIAFYGVWSSEQIVAVIFGDIWLKLGISAVIAVLYLPFVERRNVYN